MTRTMGFKAIIVTTPALAWACTCPWDYPTCKTLRAGSPLSTGAIGVRIRVATPLLRAVVPTQGMIARETTYRTHIIHMLHMDIRHMDTLRIITTRQPILTIRIITHLVEAGRTMCSSSLSATFLF